MDGFEIEGLDELGDFFKDLELTDAEEKSAMKKAIEPMDQAIQNNIPEKTGKMEKSKKSSVKKVGFATIGEVKVPQWYTLFQEFGTSFQKAHLSFFANSVEQTQDEVVEILAAELLKNIS